MGLFDNRRIKKLESKKLDVEIRQLTNGLVKQNVEVQDGYTNNYLNMGNGSNDAMNASSYVSNRQLTWNSQTINNVVRSEPLMKKVLEFKASRPIKNGIDISSKNMKPEEIKAICERLKFLFKDIYQLIFLGEAYGGTGALICIRNQMSEDKLVKPLQIDSIQPGSFLGLKVFERWFSIRPDMSKLITEVGGSNGIDDPNLLGKPLYYYVRLTPNSPEILVHRTRLLLYNTGELTYVEKLVEQYWGMSIVEKLWDALNEYNSAFKYMNNMLMISNQRVVKLADVFTDSVNATNKAKEVVRNKLELISSSLNGSNILFLSEDDTFEYHSAQLSNVSECLQKASLNFATKANVPYSYLFDDTNTEVTPSEDAYDAIKNVQDIFCREWYTKLIKILWKDIFGGKIPEFSFEFKNIRNLDEKTKAEIISKVGTIILDLYRESITDKAITMESFSEINDNVGDVFNNFTQEYIKKVGKETKNYDQINLARALNKGADSVSREKQGGQTNEEKPTPKPKIE